MLSLDTLGFYTTGKSQSQRAVNRDPSSIGKVLAVYELGMSKAFAVPLVAHTVPTSPSIAQRRVSSIITKLPVVALWLLVGKPSLRGFGLVLAVLAIRAASPEVQQAHTRLTTAGLAAQLFDWQHARKEAQNDRELFQETAEKDSKETFRKRVSVKCTAPGGAGIYHGECASDIFGRLRCTPPASVETNILSWYIVGSSALVYTTQPERRTVSRVPS
jgi:hypothetical protein